MSLFKSKVFWLCAVVCIGIAGFFGVNAYKSKFPQEPLKIYKTTQSAPAVKSSEKKQGNPVSVDQADPIVETVDSFEKELPEEVTVEADVPLSTSDDFEEFTDGDSQVVDQNDDMFNDKTDLDFDPSDFSAEVKKQFMSIMDRYPLLSMSEAEIMRLMQTKEGLLEVKRQAEEINIEMLKLGHEYIPQLSDEEKQQAKEETRRMLSEHLSPADIEAYISQFPW